ncbi:glutathione S-transferase isoform X2 [Amyelois transitella]|uniref:glutathione S-transferase isoform X2 n=1 Tax=Amyelois transitella TaxID=680683 RepID=UPI00298FD43D|nr:glutathione S-transferase isoform X2 [Amyelois transitella]
MLRKLHYFHLNGLAESSRYMLHYAGLEFQDIRYDMATWPIKKIKDFYEEGDRRLNQSIAIARYIASQTNLLPSDPWEQAVLDAAVLNINDYRSKVREYYFNWILETDPVRKEQLGNGKDEFESETNEFYLSRFEKELKANKGYFGGKLSWADFYLVGCIETANLFAGYEIEEMYPNIRALVKTIRSLPGVKEYIATRKPYI